MSLVEEVSLCKGADFIYIQVEIHLLRGLLLEERRRVLGVAERDVELLLCQKASSGGSYHLESDVRIHCQEASVDLEVFGVVYVHDLACVNHRPYDGLFLR